MYYQLDPQAAKEASVLSNRIMEKGQYTGTFTRAQKITTKNGIEGIDFDFVTDDGKRARFFLYTRRENGATIYGYKQLMTILTCMRLHGINAPQMQFATVWDSETQEEKQADVPQFVDLLNKPIGLLLHMEEYKPNQGEDTKWRVAFAHAFEAQTGLMSGEILDKKTTAEQLPKAVASLRDRPLKTVNANGNASSGGSAHNRYEAAKNGNSSSRATQEAAVTGAGDFEDDIPF